MLFHYEQAATTAAVIFSLFYGQFVLLAGGAYMLVWMQQGDRFAAHRIQQRPRRAPKPRRELAFSTVSIALFSLMLTALSVLTALGWTRVYFDVAAYGWPWFVASIGVMALVHDSYYYWAHRFMHHPKVFRHVHKLHHEFHNPTPWACYAFHPYEALIEVAWVAPAAVLLPIHPAAFATYIVFLTVMNVIAHLGHEFWPAWVARWFLTSTHHNMHHTRARGHFMLYFNFWDRLMGTNAGDYETRMVEIGDRVASERARRRRERAPVAGGHAMGTV